MNILKANWDWRLMAKVQDMLAVIDGSESCAVHNLVGRVVGSIPKPYNPIPAISSGVGMVKQLQEAGGGGITGKIFFEVGTGWVPILPMVYWLTGAEKTITVDLNPYMQKRYVTESLRIVNTKKTDIAGMFGSILDKKRFADLLKFSARRDIRLQEYLELCHIEYVAPGDAAATTVAAAYIDYHTSHSVYEHIPRETLKGILLEGNRITKGDGLFVNQIDYKDHFSYYAKDVSPLNFLQYSDEEWKRYNNNKYIYVNRLRHDDFVSLFKEAGHDFVVNEPRYDEGIMALLQKKKLKIHEQFLQKGNKTLAITSGSFLTKLQEHSE